MRSYEVDAAFSFLLFLSFLAFLSFFTFLSFFHALELAPSLL